VALIFSDKLLNALRGIGDSVVDPYLGNPDDRPGEMPEPPREEILGPPPPFEDHAKLDRASALFSHYGSEIGAALLLAALPEAYAASFGSFVLYNVSALAEPGDSVLTHRVGLTAQFLVNVMVAEPTPSPGSGDRPGPDQRWSRSAVRKGHEGATLGRALEATLNLRALHSWIRSLANSRLRGGHDDVPEDFGARRNDVFLNQEDLLGTLLTFSVTVFEVLEQFGVSWSADDQQAYLHAWDVVGHWLGIGTPEVVDKLLEPNLSPDQSDALDESDKDELTKLQGMGGSLRPSNVADARALLARIRSRVWTPYGNPNPKPPWNFAQGLEEKKPGRILLQALVSDIQQAMPPDRQLWPIRAMRQPACRPDRSGQVGVGGDNRSRSDRRHAPATIGASSALHRRQGPERSEWTRDKADGYRRGGPLSLKVDRSEQLPDTGIEGLSPREWCTGEG